MNSLCSVSLELSCTECLSLVFPEVHPDGSSQPASGEKNKEVQRVQMGQLEVVMGPKTCVTVCGGEGEGAAHLVDDAN